MNNQNKEQPKHKPFEIQFLGENHRLPKKAKSGSIGYDLTVPEDIVIPAHKRIGIPINIAINLPFGIEGKVEPRSGFSLKGVEGHSRSIAWHFKWGFLPIPTSGYTHKKRFNADVINGKIDPGYTDNIHVILKNCDKEFLIKAGTRIAQITFYKTISPKFQIVEKLSCESRGGGLGSSGTTDETNEQKA